MAFIDDSAYSNAEGAYLLSPLGLGYGVVKDALSEKKNKAKHKVYLASLKEKEAENRASFSKTFEERRKAEQDVSEAKQEVSNAKNELANVEEKPKPKMTKYILIGGGVLVVGLVLFLALRKK
jgi:uncharacterized protein (DUF3084 family)